MKRRILWTSLLLFLVTAVILEFTREPPSPSPEQEPPPPPPPIKQAAEEPPPPLPADPGGAGKETIEKGIVTLVLKDLADGSLLGNFRLVAPEGSLGAEPQKLISGVDGSVVVPGALTRQLKPASGRWRVAGETQEDDRPVTLWLCEMVEVDVTVTLTGTGRRADLSQVRLWASLLMDLGPLGDESIRPPFTKTWTENAGVLPVRDLPGPVADGRVRVTLPAIKGLTISAHLAGWRPDHAAVPPKGGGDVRLAVALRLSRRALNVTGRLVDENGKPICNTRVMLYVTQRMPIGEMLTDEEIRKAGHAYTSTISEKKGYARVTWQVGVQTAGPDSETPGGFTLSSNVEGDALLVVMPPDEWVVERRSLGALSEDIHSLEIVLKEAEGLPDLLITKGGETLSGFEVLIVDLSSGDAQPAFLVRGSAEGTIGTSKLEPGHRYHFVVFWKDDGKRISRTGPVMWSGQRVLDVLDLD